MLDMKTIMTGFILGIVLQFAIILSLWMHHKNTYKGLNVWAFAYFMLAIAYLTITTLDIYRTPVSIIIINIFSILGLIFVVLGLEMFFEKNVSWKFNTVLGLAISILITVFTYISPDLRGRMITTATGNCIIWLQVAYLVFSRIKPEFKRIGYQMGVIAALLATITVFRVSVNIRIAPGNSFFSVPDLIAWSFALAQALFFGFTFSLILIVSRRLNLDLTDEIRKRTLLLEQTIRQKELLDTIDSLQSLFIGEDNDQALFDNMLLNVLKLTGSQYGFVDSLEIKDDGKPFLKTLAMSNIAWDDESRAYYDKMAPGGLRFFDFHSLFGPAVKKGEIVISNYQPDNPRRKETPEGHPPIDTFLAVPLKHEDNIIGVITMANRDEGYDENLVKELDPIWVTCSQLVNAFKNKEEKENTEKELQKYANTQAILIREINHRVKNNLAIVKGLINTEVESIPSGRSLAKQLMRRMLHRIEGLDTVHRLLSASYWQPIRLSELCSEILSSIKTTLRKYDLLLDVFENEIHVTSSQAHYLSIILNELAINTIKYGTSSHTETKITVTAYVQKNNLFIVFKDNGSGFPKDMLRKGVSSSSHGLGLVKGLIEHSMQGKLSLQNDCGAKVAFKINNTFETDG